MRRLTKDRHMPQTKRARTFRSPLKPGKSKRIKTYTYTVKIHRADPDETGYWAEVPALPGCFTQGETIEECLQRAPEAITGHLKSLIELDQPIPEETDGDDAVIGKVLVEMPVSAGAGCQASPPANSFRRSSERVSRNTAKPGVTYTSGTRAESCSPRFRCMAAISSVRSSTQSSNKLA